MNAKQLGNVLAKRLRTTGQPNTGESQIGTSNPPEPISPPKPPTGGIVIPASQLGDVKEGDIITLEVVSNDGENVSLKKVEQPQ